MGLIEMEMALGVNLDNRTNDTLNLKSPLLYAVITTTFAILLTLSFQQTSSASFFDNLLGSAYKTYENESYNVKVDYGKDWTYENMPFDKDFPETLFKVNFYTPFQTDNNLLGSVSVSIDELKPVVTLDQYKDRITNNLKNAGVDKVKDITVTATTLNGEPAFRLEYMIWMLQYWEKSIDIISIKNARLHEISALGTVEAMEKYSEPIKKMFESVKFE